MNEIAAETLKPNKYLVTSPMKKRATELIMALIIIPIISNSSIILYFIMC